MKIPAYLRGGYAWRQRGRRLLRARLIWESPIGVTDLFSSRPGSGALDIETKGFERRQGTVLMRSWPKMQEPVRPIGNCRFARSHGGSPGGCGRRSSKVVAKIPTRVRRPCCLRRISTAHREVKGRFAGRAGGGGRNSDDPNCLTYWAELSVPKGIQAVTTFRKLASITPKLTRATRCVWSFVFGQGDRASQSVALLEPETLPRICWMRRPSK